MAKRELLASIQGRYPGSSKRDNKGRILDKFIATACHRRKQSIRLQGPLGCQFSSCLGRRFLEH